MVRKSGGTPAVETKSRKIFASSSSTNSEVRSNKLQLFNVNEQSVPRDNTQTTVMQTRQTSRSRAKPVILQRFLEGLSNCEDHNLNILLQPLAPVEVRL